MRPAKARTRKKNKSDKKNGFRGVKKTLHSLAQVLSTLSFSIALSFARIARPLARACRCVELLAFAHSRARAATKKDRRRQRHAN